MDISNYINTVRTNETFDITLGLDKCDYRFMDAVKEKLMECVHRRIHKGFFVTLDDESLESLNILEQTLNSYGITCSVNLNVNLITIVTDDSPEVIFTIRSMIQEYVLVTNEYVKMYFRYTDFKGFTKYVLDNNVHILRSANNVELSLDKRIVVKIFGIDKIYKENLFTGHGVFIKTHQ